MKDNPDDSVAGDGFDERIRNLPENDQECVLCGESNYVQNGSELVCPECFHVPIHESKRRTEKHDPWDFFDRKRDEYSGFYGPERVKMVGGFARIYFEEDGWA